ncbi:MAG TPA: hypothetical protein VF078_10470, partial [Nitrospira sp.]
YRCLALMVPIWCQNTMTQANLDEKCSFPILINWQKVLVPGVLDVLSLGVGGTLNQRVSSEACSISATRQDNRAPVRRIVESLNQVLLQC